MKKLFLASLLVVGGLTAYANSAVQYPKVAIESNIQDEFKEIAADALPEAVQAALKKDHPNAVLGKAYVNDKKYTNWKLPLISLKKYYIQMKMETGLKNKDLVRLVKRGLQFM